MLEKLHFYARTSSTWPLCLWLVVLQAGSARTLALLGPMNAALILYYFTAPQSASPKKWTNCILEKTSFLILCQNLLDLASIDLKVACDTGWQC